MQDHTFWGWVTIPVAMALLALIVWLVKLSSSRYKLLKALIVGAITLGALLFLWSSMQWASWYK